MALAGRGGHPWKRPIQLNTADKRPGSYKRNPPKRAGVGGLCSASGGWIRTNDLRAMTPLLGLRNLLDHRMAAANTESVFAVRSAFLGA